MPPFRIDSKDGTFLDRSELIAEPRFLFRLFILDLCKLFFVGTETVAAMYFLLSGGDGKRLLAHSLQIKSYKRYKILSTSF
jgi:hypothetical protein